MEPRKPPAGRPAERSRTSALVKVAVAVLAPCLFLAFAEIVLAIGGVRVPAYAGLPPGVADYWIPYGDDEASSGFQRSFPRRYRFRPEPLPVFVRVKPKNGYRAFILGESSVEGTPYELGNFCDWLRLRLGAMLPGRFVEVVNAGNPGWHATEIRTLLQECLRHDADLVVWMVGHNEMVPQNVIQLRNEHAHPWRSSLVSFVRGLRVAEVLRRRLLRAPNDRIAAFADIDTARSRCFGEEFPLLQRRFREATEGAVGDARRARVPIVLCTLPRNVTDQPPSVSVHRVELRNDPSLAAVWRGALGAARNRLDTANDAEGALSILTRAERIDDEPAELHFVKGRALERLGRLEEARASYLRALELDGCPMRALPWVEAAIREIAMKYDVPLVDLERIFDAAGRIGLAGSEFICDNVHPSLDGHERIAEEILDVLETQLSVPLQRELDVRGAEGRRALGLDAYREFQASCSECLANLRLVLESNACNELWIRTRALCESALRLQPNQWEVSAALGLLDVMGGERDTGRARIERALREDAYVRTSYIFYYRTQEPFRRVLDNAGVDIGSVERSLTPGEKMQLDNRLARFANR